MAIGITSSQQDLIDSISHQISIALNAQAGEEHFPGEDPDRMDETIDYNRKQAAKLRVVRHDLENLFSGVCS
jgi:hypothetical protein